MSSDDKKAESSDGLRRGGINLGAFIVVLGFVWLVFDNLALALLFALVFAGGAEAAQRIGKKSD
ncbi:MAG: hypothetical protein NXI12_01430 [Alphaproteobacteria bacterium]|nr:hypothetical protein [Alphaproteobacteria bacterium]